jgi:hypothetical protein
LARRVVLVFDGVAQAVAGGVEISKQAFDVALGGVAVGGGFDGGKDVGQIGVQALVGVGVGRDVGEQLAGVDEVALGLDGVVFDLGGVMTRCRQPACGVVDAVVTAFDVGAKFSLMKR